MGPMNGQIVLATGGYDHTIKLWRAETKDCLKTMQHNDSVRLFNALKKYSNNFFFIFSKFFIFN